MHKLCDITILGEMATAIMQYYAYDKTNRIKFARDFDEKRQIANAFIGMGSYPIVFNNMHKKDQTGYLSSGALDEIKSLWELYKQYPTSMFEFGIYKCKHDYLLVGIDDFTSFGKEDIGEVPYVVKQVDSGEHIIKEIDTNEQVYKEWKVYAKLTQQKRI